MTSSFDLVIVGTGSGNSIPTPAMDDWSIAIVEKGVFGGTCLNVGCIPSKMLVYAADVARIVHESERWNVSATLDAVDWQALRDRVFGRIDPIVADGERYRREGPNTTVFAEEARFVEPRVLSVGGEQITGDQIVLAAGSRPAMPPIAGLENVDCHTSDTIMRIDEIPERLIVLGAGYIAAELGHVFEAFGSDVAIATRGPTMLTGEDTAVREAFTAICSERFDLFLDATFTRAEQSGDTIVIEGEGRHGPFRIEGDALLAAVGRVPNSDVLDVGVAGIHTHPDGRVVVDDTLATGVPGIWAFGDLANAYQLKHLANEEARVVAHNVLHPAAPRRVDYSLVPHAVFARPQVASVGLTESEAEAAGIPYECVVYPYGDTTYGWAMEDADGFVKLVMHTGTRRLVGAHILGEQASTLLQMLIQGMHFERTVDEMAHDQLYIHPALTEVVENALLKFSKR